MKETYKLLMLHALKFKINIDNFIELGLTYSQIAQIIAELQELSLITKDLILTEDGGRELDRLNNKINKENQYNWLQPLFENKIERIGIFEVYFPNKLIN